MQTWLVLSETHLPVPKKRYRKNILKVGKFAKMTEDGKKEMEFELTQDNLTSIAAESTQMLADGHRIPVPLGHTQEEDKNQGYVDKFGVEGDYLFMEAEAVGKEAIENFEQSDCSCYIPPKYKDSEGREYTRPIRHVALTQYPVIVGLGKFEAIAASLVPVRKEEPMKFDKIQAALSLSETLTEENAETLILGGIGQLVEKAKAAGTTEDPLAAAKEALKSMPGIIPGLKNARETKLQGLVLAQKISPAVKDKLAEMFTSEDSLVLSTTVKEGESEFDKLCLILSENTVVKTGEETGVQTLDDPNQGGSNGGKNPLMQSMEKLKASS